MERESLPKLSDRFPTRASEWKLRSRTLHFHSIPLVMGILNVTPDSFSDGGNFFDIGRAIDQALRMEANGADIIDIGGESTRPYATPVLTGDELRRVVPVIEAIADQISIPISIDTMKAKVAQESIAAGAEIINDVSGLAGDPQMVQVALESGAGVCAMHMQGNPQTMQDNPSYNLLVEEILGYLNDRQAALVSAGFHPTQICLDPGIGFGKTHQHNLDLMANCWRFHQTGRPLLVGHSRKGFLAKILGDKEKDRTLATVGATLSLATQGVQVIRVHNVQENKEALQSFAACGGIDATSLQLS